MNTKSTELDNSDKSWDSKDNRDFAIEIIVGMVMSFLVGAVIATGCIFFCLSLID